MPLSPFFHSLGTPISAAFLRILKNENKKEGVGQIIELIIKQWPLAPNLPKWQITRANVLRRVTFLLKTCQIRRSECIESGLSRVANLANLANF
jgi:hypothetical protein